MLGPVGSHRIQGFMNATSLYVKELYLSIQGEARYAGYPCVFVRLSGCPLRCRWCDTAYGFEGGEVLEFEVLYQRIAELNCSHVELTGGEPLAQDQCIPFMRGLVDRGYTVMIETGGSEPIEEVPSEVHIIMDLKCPQSGMVEKNRFENIAHLKPTDEVKFVIADRADFDWAIEQINLYDLPNPLMSVAFALLQPATLVEWILASKKPIKLNMQIHKYIWHPRTKGV
jgi:7-carboxy-7-deazaguanine synthase